jgi:spore germination protein GerM
VKRIAVLVLAALTVTAACRKKDDPEAAARASNKVAVRMVQLYYASGMQLAPEPRNVPLPESPAAAIPLVIRELVKGPAAATSLRLLPADTIVRGAYLIPGGTVIVDLGGPTLTAGWGTGSHQELMAVYSIVQTATANFADARRVRILVNGTPAETLGGHISLAHSLAPRADLIGKR